MTTNRIWRVIVSIGICAVIMKAPSGKPGDLPDDNSGKILPGGDNRSYGTPILISGSQLRDAALAGDIEKMQLLIAAGIDINQSVSFPPFSKTVLMIAAEKGYNDMIAVLLEAGADIDAKDNAEFPNDSSVDGDTAFMYAVRGGNYDTVKLFIQLGVDVNQKNRTTKTPLHYAASRGYNDIAELLLEAGADVNIQTRFPPLTMAVGGNHIDLVNTLIAAGADVNMGNGEALRGACFYGNQEIVKILLEAGADVNFEYERFKKGRREVVTVITIAKERGYDDIVSLLKAAGAVE